MELHSLWTIEFTGRKCAGWQWEYNVFQASCPQNSIHIEIESRYDQFGFIVELLQYTKIYPKNSLIDKITDIFYKTIKREGWNVQVDEECGAVMELSDLNLPFIQFQKKDFRRACFFIVKVGSGLGTKISFKTIFVHFYGFYDFFDRMV